MMVPLVAFPKVSEPNVPEAPSVGVVVQPEAVVLVAFGMVPAAALVALVPPLAIGRVPVTPVEPELARFAATCAAGIWLVSATVPAEAGRVMLFEPTVTLDGSFIVAAEKSCKPVV